MLKILKLSQSYLKSFSSWGIDVLEFEHQSFGSAGKALPLDKLALDSLRTHNRSLENRQMQMKTKIFKAYSSRPNSWYQEVDQNFICVCLFMNLIDRL